MLSLLRRQAIPQTIVVGVWNRPGYRHAEYFPQGALRFLPPPARDSLLKKELHDTALADAYLRFLVTELKPYIDSAYATLRGPEHTAIGGSSMGGLISLYALCEYPKVFGSAACLSTHWPGSLKVPSGLIPAAFLSYLDRKLPQPGRNRLYFDYGTATLDSLYPPLQAKVDALLRRKGYTARHWTTRAFPGEAHTEQAWARRLALPLTFVLSRQGSGSLFAEGKSRKKKP
jgi:enterochelin esterase-like enzyme